MGSGTSQTPLGDLAVKSIQHYLPKGYNKIVLKSSKLLFEKCTTNLINID